MKTIDPQRPAGQISVLAQDEPGGLLRLTRHTTLADAATRDAPGLMVHESDAGQIIHRPKLMTSAEAARLIESHHA